MMMQFLMRFDEQTSRLIEFSFLSENGGISNAKKKIT